MAVELRTAPRNGFQDGASLELDRPSIHPSNPLTTWPRSATALSSVVSPAALAIFGAASTIQPQPTAANTVVNLAITCAQTALFIYEVCSLVKMRTRIINIDKLATTVLIVGLLTTYLVTGLSCVSYFNLNNRSAVAASVGSSGT